jgi:hypothetical protein
MRRASTSLLASLALVVVTCGGASAARVAGPGWHPIASAPIAGRISAGTVWTGSEMIVWGGYSLGGTFTVNRDGAAYDPATNRWRRIRNAPAGVRGGGGTAAAWTGDVAIFWAGNSPDGPARGAVYDPAGDSWRKLPPGPLGPREGYVSAWTGDELLIIGGTEGDGFASPLAAAVTPDGHWRLLPALNDLEALIPSGAVWDGSRVFVTGAHYLCAAMGSACQDLEQIAVAYDPATDDLTVLAPPVAAPLRVVGRAGHQVLFIAQGARTRTFVYDTAMDTWRVGARGPCRALEDGAQLAWIGHRLVQACGHRRLQIYRLATDGWRTVLAGGSQFNRLRDSQIAWTGRRLIVWSGVGFRHLNPTPNAGSRIPLRR